MWEHGRKLQRAAEHFKQLEAQLRGWEEGNGYTLNIEPDSEPPSYVAYAEILRPVEDEPFPLVLGDFLQNARSVLDYLAVALGDAGAGGVMDKRDALVTKFPIARNSERFAQLAKGYLPTVSDPVRAAIERLQPYEAGGDLWHIEPLWVLNELARFDRHRLLHIGYERIGGFRLNPTTSRNVRIADLHVIDGPFELAEINALEAGDECRAKLATFSAFPIDPDQKMHMDWEGAVEITFDADRLPDTLRTLASLPITAWLWSILPEIRKVIGTLSSFLPAEPPGW